MERESDSSDAPLEGKGTVRFNDECYFENVWKSGKPTQAVVLLDESGNPCDHIDLHRQTINEYFTP